MADVTAFTQLSVFQWSRPDAESPRLASPIEDTDTTITVTNPPLDEDGKIQSNPFLMGIRNNETGYTETVYVPANAVQGYGNVPDTTNLGLTITGVTRGVDLAGLDPTTQNDATLAVDHPQDSLVYGNISAILYEMVKAVFAGAIPTGGEEFEIGNNDDNDILIYINNGDANRPFLKYISADNKWVVSNDGTTELDLASGGVSTAGDGIDITAGTISIDLSTTSGLRFTGGELELDPDVNTLFAADGEASDAYAITLTPAPTAYATGQSFTFTANTANTGAATLNVNTLGAKTIKKANDQDLETGDIESGQVVEVVYDGTNFQMISQTAVTPISSSALDPAVQLRTVDRIVHYCNYQVTNTTGGSSVTDYGGGVFLQTGANNGDDCGVNMQAYASGFATSLSPKMFVSMISTPTTSNRDVFIGLSNTSTPAPSGGTWTAAHAGFIISGTAVYASVADGATQEKSADLSITTTARNNYYIEESGGNYNFYVNGSLVHTSTANEPSSMGRANAWIGTLDSAIKQIVINSFVVTTDKS